jgi:hypothetical protein
MNAINEQLADRLRTVARDVATVDTTAIALYGAVKPTEALWVDLPEANRVTYRRGVRVAIDTLAHLIEDAA